MRNMAVTSNLEKNRDSLSISLLDFGGQSLYLVASFVEIARFQVDCPCYHSILRCNSHACRCYLYNRAP